MVRYHAVYNPSTGSTDQVPFTAAEETARDLEETRTLAQAKKDALGRLSALANNKLALGWNYGVNTYQIGGKYSANMSMFLSALERFTRKYPEWFTTTAYVAGNIVHQSNVFYKCMVSHTSVVLLDDLNAGKWAKWYFHPHLDGDGKWTASNNTRVSLSITEAETMCQGALNYEMLLILASRNHKDAINALTTTAEVDAYIITANWPANS